MGKNFTIEESGAPDQFQMMLATIRALRKMGGSANIHELSERIVAMENITEDEQSIMKENDSRTKLNYHLAWARTALRLGGALKNSSRGVWALTDEGMKITPVKLRTVYERISVKAQSRAKKKELAKKKKSTDESHRRGQQLEPFVEVQTEDWQPRLLDVLQEMDASAFERLAQRLLREAGFTKVEVRGKIGDGGLDGIGVLSVNLVSFQVYFQCKRWKGSVGAEKIRDFRGALQGRADKGLFITTGNFTSGASKEATREGAIAIDLIDGSRLCGLLKEFDLGVRTEKVEMVTISREWFKEI